MEFKDVFSWSYKTLKRNPKTICEHKIELTFDGCPIKQYLYRMNPNYVKIEWVDKIH
jgi:hypothetical protein